MHSLAFAFALLSFPAHDSLPSMSQQQADSLIATLRSGSADLTQLSTLPIVAGKDIQNLKAFTGIHRILPNSGEDYFALNALVGNKLYAFRFTVTPTLSREANAPDLASILANGRVTQYDVTFVVRGKNNDKVTNVTCHSRQNVPRCHAAE